MNIARAGRGFSLIELLVAIAIVGVLLSLLLPAVMSARESARRTQCQSNLRQLAVAAQTYHDAARTYPPGVDQQAFPTSPQYRGVSLFVFLLPQLEYKSLREQWVFGDPLLNASTGSPARTSLILPELLCPSDAIPANPITKQNYPYGIGSYGGNGGTRSYPAQNASTDGIFHTTGAASEPQTGQRPARIKDVQDGLSHTFLFGERNHLDPGLESFVPAGWANDSLAAWGWWAPSGERKSIAHVTMSTAAPLNYNFAFNYTTRLSASPPVPSSAALQPYIILRLNAWGSSHGGGANFALADGSVRFVTDDISDATLAAYATRAGHEIVGGAE